MFKLNTLASAVALALVLPSSAFAEFEVSGEAKIEYGLFTSDGTVTGATESHDAGDAIKSETTLKLFINSEVGEDSSFHAEVLLSNEGEAASDRLEGGEADSQYEVLREFYFDTNIDDWYFRLGKQQVVWGTADGIKLLDIINPTDFREMNQNAAEDSRLPVWMINAEKDLDNGGNIQIILSEAKANFISGLDGDGDSGAPFLFKGVDTITGSTNGFLNIANDFGKTAGVFNALLSMGGVTGLVANDGTPTAPMSTLTVSAFANMDLPTFGGMAPAIGAQIGASNGLTQAENLALFNNVFAPMMTNIITNGATNLGGDVLDLAANNRSGLFSQFQTFMGTIADPTTQGALFSLMRSNLYGGLSLQGVDTAVDAQVAGAITQGLTGTAMDGTTITTANVTNNDTVYQNAVQLLALQGMAGTFTDGTTTQFSGTLDTTNPSSAFDYMGNTTFATFDSFVNMSTDYRKAHKDKSEQNFGFRYKNSTDGGTNYSINYAYRMDANPYIDMHWEDSSGNKLSVDTIDTPAAQSATGQDQTTVILKDSNGTRFSSQGGFNPATLVMEEKLQRINTIGFSFDSAIDTASIPVILRGEFSYDIGTKVPVINQEKLDYGDLAGGLKMEETDIFKYVLGVDVTVMSNLLVSTQLIQMYNLDYVDNDDSYSGDFSSMHVTNGLNKGDEVETFVSFFLSKPFGDDGQHRWNNIIIAENGGGYWNRFDVEYGINDEMVGTIEINKYWGDEDTTFGQFEKSSNLQVGLKYLF